MKPITVLVSASGAPGTAALLRALRENGEREVRLVGTDMSERSVGRHLCDVFHLVPAGSDPGFADAILDVVGREAVDAVLPQSSFDLQGLAEHRNRFPVPVLVSAPETIRRSNDKAETYELLHRLGVPAPGTHQHLTSLLSLRCARNGPTPQHNPSEVGFPCPPRSSGSGRVAVSDAPG